VRTDTIGGTRGASGGARRSGGGARVITVFGSINLDLIAHVSRLPHPGETVPGTGFATAPGGKGANQALAAARAGAAVSMVGAVGGDSFADDALVLLRDGGVDLERVGRVPGATGVALIQVDEKGENTIAVVPGANGAVAATAAGALSFAPGDVLLLQLEVPVAAVEAAAARARSKGASVLLNFAPFRDDALRLVKHATHLIVNESECALVSQALGIPEGALGERAAALSARTASCVIVTLGPAGALAVANGSTLRVPALAVKAIDAVGAGDTFCGYLACAIGEGMTLARALRIASVAASLACTKHGAQPSIPPRDDVEAALEREEEA
jgi:ribokinase